MYGFSLSGAVVSVNPRDVRARAESAKGWARTLEETSCAIPKDLLIMLLLIADTPDYNGWKHPEPLGRGRYPTWHEYLVRRLASEGFRPGEIRNEPVRIDNCIKYLCTSFDFARS